MPIYVDTSALVKRYVLEAASDAFDGFLMACDEECVISGLGTVEFESVLQRLNRQGHIDASFLQQARNDFTADLVAALWSVHAFDVRSFSRAGQLIRELGTPLATLDALHLASALQFGCDGFATSDRQLSRAASRSGLVVHDFFE